MANLLVIKIEIMETIILPSQQNSSRILLDKEYLISKMKSLNQEILIINFNFKFLKIIMKLIFFLIKKILI